MGLLSFLPREEQYFDLSIPKIQSDTRRLCLDQPYSSLPRAIRLPVRFAPQLVKKCSRYFEADQLHWAGNSGLYIY